MKTLLTQAPESLYWYWISERHAIYLRRMAGEKKPWTTDHILRDYKFTNPFRENDKGTVWLRENFLQPHRFCNDCDKGIRGGFPCESCKGLGWNPELIAFNICWYRMFNWTSTGELLGWQTDWDGRKVEAILEQQLALGQQVFTGAHIVYSPPGMAKVDAITKVCYELFKLRHAIANTALQSQKLEYTFNLLKTVHCVGGFMAYEMVSDMRHTKLLEDATDIMTWANPGPGAKRGLQRLGMPYSPDYLAIKSMQKLLGNAPIDSPELTNEQRFNAYGMMKTFPTFEMRDIEHSLCEFDKYCRVKFGEGKPRSMYPGAV